MKYSESNWNYCLESLGFTEQMNRQFGGMMVFNDDGVPTWTYETEEEKVMLFMFFRGMVYWKIHSMFKN